MKRLLICALLAMTLVPATGLSIPLLQLYIEGSSYDSDTETWVTTASNFKLWVIGNVSGPGGAGPILGVRLAAAHASNELGTITLTETRTSYLPDPSTPSAPAPWGSGSGTQPLLNDGSALPAHGVYGPGTDWQDWDIGDMTLNDSPLADFISATPSYPADFTPTNTGQINVYDVAVTGYSQVHFDAYNHVSAGNHMKYVNAPFSHDADQVPEPATLLLLGAGLTGAAGNRFLRRRKHS